VGFRSVSTTEMRGRTGALAARFAVPRPSGEPPAGFRAGRHADGVRALRGAPPPARVSWRTARGAPAPRRTRSVAPLRPLGRFGPEEARGVAVVNTSVTDRELKDLHAAGVRGIRFNLSPPGTTTFQMITPLSKLVEPMGWHIQVNASGDQIVESKELWNRVPCPIVFDHIGHVPLPAGMNHPVFPLLSELLQKGKAWLKLSGAYMETKVGAPTYSDTVPVVRAFVKAAPERLVWGSDWPHPTEKVKPNDAILLDLLAEWVPDTATRNRILVDNPAKLYGF